MAGGLQLVQAAFSIRQPDPDGIFTEKGHGQDQCHNPISNLVFVVEIRVATRVKPQDQGGVN